MLPPDVSIRDLARRLLALEASKEAAPDQGNDGCDRVFEKLRNSLTKFAGADAFTSLMKRALNLARGEHPQLSGITVDTDGILNGFETDGEEGRLSIIANLLGLLVTFIGEPLTFRLVRDAWPDDSLEADHLATETEL